MWGLTMLGRLLSWTSIREHGGEPSSRQVDELLDERLAQLRGASEDVAVDT
jgi:hypothetical protein